MKKSTWKTIVTSGVALASVATLAACSSNKTEDAKSSSDTVSLKLWVPTDAKESYEATVKAFEEAEGVSVKIVESNDSKAQENVKKDPEKAADVFSLPHDQLGQLVESGVIQEIPEQYATEVAENNVENAVAGAQYQGKTYAFPFGVESQVLFYNKSKLSEDDVKTYEGITSKATFGASLKEVNAYAIAPLMLSVGNTLFGEDGETIDGTNWGNDKGVAVMQWLADQKDNSGFVNVTDAEAVSKFGDGTVAAIETGPWNYAAAEEAIGADNLGVTVYPTVTIDGETVQQQAFMGVKLYAVNQAPAGGDAKRIDASYKLAAYLTEAESQKNQFETRNIIPSNKEVQSSDAVANNQLAKAVSSMTGSAEHTTVMPKVNQMATFWTESAALLSGPYSGKIAPADFLAKLQQFDKDLAATE